MVNGKKTDNTNCRGKQELSFIAGGNTKLYSHLEYGFSNSYKVKHSLAMLSSNCTPKYLSN